jgi:predicted nucleic acid-binding protein
MKVTVDTNVLIPAVVGDDPKQSKAAAKILIEAQLIAIAVPSLCEFVWVLIKVYWWNWLFQTLRKPFTRRHTQFRSKDSRQR